MFRTGKNDRDRFWGGEGGRLISDLLYGDQYLCSSRGDRNELFEKTPTQVALLVSRRSSGRRS